MTITKTHFPSPGICQLPKVLPEKVLSADELRDSAEWIGRRSRVKVRKGRHEFRRATVLGNECRRVNLHPVLHVQEKRGIGHLKLLDSGFHVAIGWHGGWGNKKGALDFGPMGRNSSW